MSFYRISFFPPSVLMDRRAGAGAGCDGIEEGRGTGQDETDLPSSTEEKEGFMFDAIDVVNNASHGRWGMVNNVLSSQVLLNIIIKQQQ